MEEIHLGLESLKKSSLYRYRKDNDYIPVIGEGNISASIMFIGEAPGKTEQNREPFCGRSGIMLDELLASIKLDRADVYVTNLVKDRPQDNRDPSPEEIALYGPFLDSQNRNNTTAHHSNARETFNEIYIQKIRNRIIT